MLYRLVRPVIRKGTRNPQFVKRIPSDLRERMIGITLSIPVADEVVRFAIGPTTQAIRVSLRSSDPGEVKSRHAVAADYVERVFQAYRAETPATLSHRQAVSLSREIYQAWASDPDTRSTITWVQENDGSITIERKADLSVIGAGMRQVAGKLAAIDTDLQEMERHLGPIADRLLVARGIVNLDPGSRELVLHELHRALKQGLEVGARKADGDYTVDPHYDRFPEWRAPTQKAASGVSLRGLADGWWKEMEPAGLSPSTYESYRRAINALADFLGHDDTAAVTESDILRFKDNLISGGTGKPVGTKTVKDSYLAGLKSLFGWAVNNRKMAFNPAADIKLRRGKKNRVRDSWFRPEEMKAILSASSCLQRGRKEPPAQYALKRWVPWLCAYTGARVGEIVQLRKQDVRQEGGTYVITITPEAGRVKNKEAREVPLHSHLIEMGFAEFVKDAREGYLFMWSGEGRAAWRTAKNRLTAFVREMVPDPNVQPNHGWRHTFKTIGSEAGIQDKVLDAICGHGPGTVGDGYGGVTLKARMRAMEMFPKFWVP